MPDAAAGSRPPGLFQNALSLVGAGIAIVAGVNIAFLVLVDYFHPSPYLGIFAYMILPAIMILGLVLVAIGMALERRRRRHLAPGEVPRYPRIDFNNPHQRKAFAFFLAITAIFISLSAAGSYQAYEFTDSVTFCGQVCHTVMEPEYTTYQQSPHARVTCVECHVGSGASWYVKSKLSGSYQVYSAAFHKYPRPIPTPVANLRPAQQTCEQCHWPARFYGAQLKVFTHFSYDEQNTPHQLRMLINVGGAEPMAGMSSGIHWHMNIANRITFIATDPQRQAIPWVQAQDRSGHVTVYVSKASTLTQQQIAETPKHLMDCIDCHDRPSHIFTPPDQAIDQALLAHRLDPAMPFIKQQAVTALAADYQSTDQAMAAIAKSLADFYNSKYPQLAAASGQPVQAAIQQVQQIYRATIFPYMKADWRVHPNNIGHYYYAGCFRCHDGQHVSAGGKVIPKDCNTCHTMLAEPQTAQGMMGNVPGVAFQHPVDIGNLGDATCSDCHTGNAM